MNQMLISGNATKDAEEKYTPKGACVVVITIAENTTGADGKEKTIYRTVNVWGPYSTEYAKNIHKGDFVVVQGRMSEPQGRVGDDGRIFVNYSIDVTDTNLYSFVKFKPKVETVVNAED